jgi:hypothetical protein
MAYDFPASPTNGQQFTPSGGPTYQWNGTVWTLAAPLTITDAPSDGSFYGRVNATWSVQYTKAALDALLAAKVAGPASSTDNALVRFDLATGKIIQNSNATLDDTGNLIVPGTITSSAGTFLGSIFAPSSPGPIYLRPNGSGSTAGQLSIDTAGNTIVNGAFTTSGNATINGNVISNSSRFIGSAAAAILAPSAAGTCYLRPNGDASTSGQASLDNLGNFAVAGWTMGSSALWNTTVPSSACAIRATFAGAGTQYGLILYSGSVAASNQVLFYNGTSPGTQVGSIVTTNSATAYNTSSDERLKDFIGLYDPQKAIDIIRADPVRDWNWIDGSGYAVGWGAQTSYAVSPDLASPPAGDDTKEVQPQVGEEGFQPWGMDQAKRTPYLWAALAAALDRIDALEARLAALEGTFTPPPSPMSKADAEKVGAKDDRKRSKK